jgi:hypothetical protein
VANDTKADSAESRAQMYKAYDARKAVEYLDPDDDDEEDPVEAAFQATQSFANRPNRSAPASDGRTVNVAQAQKQHSDRMAKLYDELDRAAEQSYRRNA